MVTDLKRWVRSVVPSTACISHDVYWPFPDIAYADVFEFVDRFDTHDEKGLVGVYDKLIDKASCDPFDDSKEAVDAFENGEWESLLLYNLANEHGNSRSLLACMFRSQISE